MNYGACVDVTCLVCGGSERICEDQIEQKEYCCPRCGIAMSESQWRRVKIDYYVSEELLRQAAAYLGVECAAIEVRAFDWVCRGMNGQRIAFDTNIDVRANPKDLEEIQQIKDEINGGE